MFDVLDPYGAEMRQLQDDEASARMELRRIIAARMPSVTFRPITDEDIDAIGSALYIYWFDVKERARDKYREKVCGALESVLPHGMPVVVGE